MTSQTAPAPRAVRGDYRARVKGGGGSVPGRDVRRCPDVIKLATYRWMVATIGGGNTAHFWALLDPKASAKPRWSARTYEPVLPLLKEAFPEEYEAYFGGREWNGGHLLMERMYNQFYANDGKTKGRWSASGEHVERFWAAGRHAAARARLDEVGWPW